MAWFPSGSGSGAEGGAGDQRDGDDDTAVDIVRDEDPTRVNATRPRFDPPSAGGAGDDDPTVARERLWVQPEDDDPTISREAVARGQPAHLLDSRYELIRQIGEGGMGEVWEARHVKLSRHVAIKFLTEEAGGPRFEREAQAIVAIDHDGVVDVLDFGETPQGVPYFVMELLDGETLDRRVAKQGPLSWAFVRNIALEVTDALAHAHEAGIIHRDLKPSNVFVLDHPPARGSSVKLIDFGIAKLLDVQQPKLTKTGFIHGTPAYMSPEQALGEDVDGRSDVYGFGCLLYFLLCGRKPFAHVAGTDALYAQVYEQAPRFAEVAPDLAIPPDVESVVFRAMAKDKSARFSSMLEMQDAIAAIPPDAGASLAGSSKPSFGPAPSLSSGAALSGSAASASLSASGGFGSTGPNAALSAAGGIGSTGPNASVAASAGHASASHASLDTGSPGRSAGEKIKLGLAVGGSIALVLAALAALAWALWG